MIENFIKAVLEEHLRRVSPYKKEILSILKKNGEMSISRIQRELKISYKETHRHIKEMLEQGLINHNRKTKGEKHSPAYISISKEGLDVLNKLNALSHSNPSVKQGDKKK